MMKEKKKKPQCGDIFSIPIYSPTEKEKFLFGRIMLDIKNQCFKKGKADRDTSFLRTPGGIVVDVFSYISDIPVFKPSPIALKGVFTDFNEELCEIIDNIPVQAQELDFSEFHVRTNNGHYFVRGEVGILMVTSQSPYFFSDLPCLLTNSGRLDSVALTAIGRSDLVQYAGPKNEINIRHRDSKKRKAIYKDLGLDINISYYEFALKYGFDTARFYV